jgi:acyl-coenzyme A thioesterase PaaI-like protein
MLSAASCASSSRERSSCLESSPMDFAVRDPDFAKRVRESFEAQAFMRLIGARLERVEPGAVDIALDFREDLTQQRGFLHAAVVSVEFKTNLLRPAKGSRFLAEARVVKDGGTITVARAEVQAREEVGDPRLVATMQATMIRQ